MQEQLLALWRQIEPRLRPIIFFVFVAMLLCETVLWYRDAAQSAVPDVVQRPKIPDSPDAAAQAQIERIAAIAVATPAGVEKTDFRALIVADMFSVRQVLEAIGQEREAASLCDRAYNLLQQQKYSEALEACDQALKIRPDHIRAKELKREIREKLKAIGVR